MADAIKAEAEKRYNEGYGWQVFVECYSPAELLEFVAECKTVKEALKLAKDIAQIHTERCQAACAESF